MVWTGPWLHLDTLLSLLMWWDLTQETLPQFKLVYISFLLIYSFHLRSCYSVWVFFCFVISLMPADICNRMAIFIIIYHVHFVREDKHVVLFVDVVDVLMNGTDLPCRCCQLCIASFGFLISSLLSFLLPWYSGPMWDSFNMLPLLFSFPRCSQSCISISCLYLLVKP